MFKRKPRKKRHPLTGNQLKVIAEKLHKIAQETDPIIDLKNGERIFVKYSYQIAEFLLQMGYFYVQTIKSLQDAGYLVLRKVQPECYYIFLNPELGKKIAEQMSKKAA